MKGWSVADGDGHGWLEYMTTYLLTLNETKT